MSQFLGWTLNILNVKEDSQAQETTFYNIL